MKKQQFGTPPPPGFMCPARREQTQPGTVPPEHAPSERPALQTVWPQTHKHACSGKLKTFVYHLLLPNHVECKTGA